MRYLKYAIGEIVLVVIGILIALGINSWNQDRLNNHREQIYLKNLKEELVNNIKNLQRIDQQKRFATTQNSGELSTEMSTVESEQIAAEENQSTSTPITMPQSNVRIVMGVDVD